MLPTGVLQRKKSLCVKPPRNRLLARTSGLFDPACDERSPTGRSGDSSRLLLICVGWSERSPDCRLRYYVRFFGTAPGRGFRVRVRVASRPLDYLPGGDVSIERGHKNDQQHDRDWHESRKHLLRKAAPARGRIHCAGALYERGDQSAR